MASVRCTTSYVIADLLNLQHLKVTEVQDYCDHYRIEAIGDAVPTTCISCSHAPYRHGTQRQSFMDPPKRILLGIERRRYRYTVCGKTLFDPLPFQI